MSKENARKFLTEGLDEPQVLEFLQAHDNPQSQEEEIEAYVSIAATIGLDFSAGEFMAAIEEASQERFAQTEESVAGVIALADNELAEVSGGTMDYHRYCESNFFDEDRACKSTYKDMENCWHSDGCDIVYHDYWDYVCKRAHFCSGGHNGA